MIIWIHIHTHTQNKQKPKNTGKRNYVIIKDSVNIYFFSSHNWLKMQMYKTTGI